MLPPQIDLDTTTLLLSVGCQWDVITGSGGTFYGFTLAVEDTLQYCTEFYIVRRQAGASWRWYNALSMVQTDALIDLIEPQEFSAGWVAYGILPLNNARSGRLIRVRQYSF